MKRTAEQFRVSGGLWHQSVRTNGTTWLVGACLVNLHKRYIETRRTTDEPTCMKCVKALAEHPDLQSGADDPRTPAQTPPTPTRAKPAKTPKLPAQSAADISQGENEDTKKAQRAKKQKVRSKPESPTLF